ncbi:ATP-dependent zinc metalloprotease FtsH [Tissierella creatinini]|nr:ATP-dependent zinc metalloprotease FtsH [Tissierella creatinini]TJX66708.1 ATP-dependent zinc metalloprotease FtsH [Soehngenia saccharolytica]
MRYKLISSKIERVTIIKSNKAFVLILMLVIALISVTFIYLISKDKPEEISYNLFLKLLDKGAVMEVNIGQDSKIEVILDNGRKTITENPRTEGFKEELLLKDVVVNEKDIEITEAIMPIIILLSLVLMVISMRRDFSGQAEKEMATISKMDDDLPQIDIRLKDVAGNEEAKRSLKEMVDFIKNPEDYIKFGARMPRGLLLYGPPGTGKTLLAKALAGEANVPFYPVSGSDFVQVYAGLGAGRIRELFKKARGVGKSVIFIDEIDCIGKKRKASDFGGSEEGDRTLNALLTEMSGFKENEGIIVVAATNRIDVLDDALLRPGRFDRQLEVELPDINARYRILKLHSKNKPLNSGIDLRKLAEETIYFSGAKLESLLNEAAIMAVKEKSKDITKEHIEKSYLKVLVGDEKLERSHIDMKDKEITAYHEAGHALIAKLIDKNNRVTRVSIIPSTRGVGGFSINLPQDKIYRTRKDLASNIMVALGGRAAEEIIYGKDYITTGASSDLEKATETIISIVGNLGMDDEYGLLNIKVLSAMGLTGENNLIERSSSILSDLYKETKKLLEDSREYLEKMTRELIIKETIDEEEVNRILEISPEGHTIN